MRDTSKTNLRNQYPADWDDWAEEETCTVWEYLITWLVIPAVGLFTLVSAAGVVGYRWGLLT